MIRRFRRALAKSLVARLVASFLGVSLVTVALLGTLSVFRARTALRREVSERLTAAAAGREQQLLRWVDQQRAEVEYLGGLAEVHAQLPALVAGGPPAAAARRSLTDFLLRTARMKNALREVFVLTVPGARVVASTDSANVGQYRVTDNYFLEGQKATYVQDVYPSPVTGRPTLSIATPLRDERGEVVAVLAAHLSLQQLDRIIADNAGLGVTGEAYLLDRYGDFVTADRFGRERFLRGASSAGIVAAVRDSSDGSGTYVNYAGDRVIGAYRWVRERHLALLVEMQQDEAFAPAQRLAVALTLVGVLSAAVLAFGGYLVARQIARPVLAVARTAEQVAGGDFRARAPVMTSDEIGRLAAAFNEMTRRLHELYADQERQVVALGRAAEALEESKRLLQGIIDNTPAYITVTDQDDRLLLINKAAAELFRTDQRVAVGRDLRSVIPEALHASTAEARRVVLSSGQPIGREAAFEVHGVRRIGYMVRFPLVEASGQAYAVCTIVNDVTEMRKAEEERRTFAEQLQHTQKLESLGVLAGGIAHDFNNLLTAILGHADLVLYDLPEGSPSRDDAERIVQAARRATELTNQMLAYAGRGKLSVELVDLNDLVTQMSSLLQVSISKKVELHYDLSTELPTVQGDPVQLQQVVMNLITNAAEAIGDRVGSITLGTEMVALPAEASSTPMRGAESVARGRYVRLVVTDTGAGMDGPTMRRIFEPFFTTKFTGRGLGLAAVQGIIRGHHGSLTVRSTVGVGTTFTVLLPVAECVRQEEETDPEMEATTMGSGTVLVADDEESVRSLAERALTRNGFRVLLARDGAEAVDLFRTHADEVEAVVLDLTMPVMDGFEALAELRRIRPEVVAVLSSGYTEHGLPEAGGTGTATFLQKPYLPSSLVARLNEVMRR